LGFPRSLVVTRTTGPDSNNVKALPSFNGRMVAQSHLLLVRVERPHAGRPTQAGRTRSDGSIRHSPGNGHFALAILII
jgi:hypothetical protein